MAPKNDHENTMALPDAGRARKPAADTTNSEVVQLRPLNIPPSEPTPIPRWLAAADDHSVVLDRHRLRAHLHYMTHPWYRVPKAAIYWAGQGVCGCWRQISHIGVGAGKVADAVYRFGAALDHEQAAKLALGTTHQYRGAERHVNTKTWRRRIIGTALVAMCILGLWLYFVHPQAGILTAIGLAGALDLIGRHGRDKSEAPPHKPRPLVYGMATSLLRAEIRILLEEEGYANSITVGDVRLDAQRHEYHVDIVTHAEIKPDLLRTIERRISAPDKSIRMVIDPDNSADRTLVIRTGNPLTKVPEAPWIPAGTVTGWAPLDLGLSNNPAQAFELTIVGQHIRIIARSGGGKTSVHLNNVIDRLSACSDVVICAGALVKSADFVAWRSVIYKLAQTVEEMDELLDWALAEIDRRDRVITAIMSDDDPTNDVSGWNASLGPAVKLILDEFPEISQYDGTKLAGPDYKPNLLEKVKKISRTGRGLCVTLVFAAQASGNEDSGSTVIGKQIGTTIIGPCTEDDTVALLGKNKRDQGYAPHLLRPATTPQNYNDAGMAVIDGPGFGADYVRGYRPFSVKARAMRREAEWREKGNRPTLPDVVEQYVVLEAETVPPALAAVDAALKHYGVDVLSSALVLEHANDAGGQWTAMSLAETLKSECSSVVVAPRRGRCRVREESLRCYHRVDVTKALSALGDRP